MIGVYTIYNTITKKYYVGSAATSIEGRFRNHKNTLRKNKHRNGRLQNSWNKYGENAFLFEILEECISKRCIDIEQYWINLLDSSNDNFGYNIAKIAGSSLGQRRTTEQKQNISNSVKGKRSGNLNPNFGKPASKENIRIAIPHRKPILQIDKNTGKTINEFSTIRLAELSTNIDRSQISKVCQGKKKFVTAGGYKWKFKNAA